MLPPISYWKRHFASFLRYGTFRKYVNLAQAYTAYLQNKVNTSSMPSFLKVEISRHCEVNCLYCYQSKEHVFYPLDTFKQLINQLKKYVFIVSLYDIGEPLHNPQLFEYIHYAHQNRIGTVISSSLSIERSEDFWHDLVASGLDYLIVAIDGITPEVYNRYRRNGNLDLVMSNLKTILHLKNKISPRLTIEWQMIDFPWNRAEQPEAEALAYQLGCDRFRLIANACEPRAKYDSEKILRQRNCVLPYIILIITAYNDVRLCYKIYNHDMRIGNLSHSSFAQIWNGEEIAKARSPKKIQMRAGCQTCKE